MKKAKVSRIRQMLQPGTIVAVPRQKGGFYFLVHLTDNRFGEAFGVIKGHFAEADIPTDRPLKPLKEHLYTDNEYVKKGKWLCIGQCTSILSAFPKHPERFHSKVHNVHNPRIGPFGSGETAEGVLRQLSEAEAKQIDLDNTYEQVMTEDEVEEYLEKKFG